MNLFKPLSEIGLEIKQKREALGWNQTELAHRAGVGRQVISGLETGAAKDAKWSTLTGLHLALGGLDVLAKEGVPQGYEGEGESFPWKMKAPHRVPSAQGERNQ